MTWALDKCEKAGCEENTAAKATITIDGLEFRLCTKHHHDFERWAISRPEYRRLMEQIGEWNALSVAYRRGGDHAADILKIVIGKHLEARETFMRACMTWLDTSDKEEPAE